MTDSHPTDEPLIRPTSIGTAMVRLTQVEGALRGGKAPALSNSHPLADGLRAAHAMLLGALTGGDRALAQQALKSAQEQLATIYAACQSLEGEQAQSTCRALGFPAAGTALSAVDVASVVVTFAKPKKQVVTSIAFEDAPGATGYWLHEITDLPNDEEIQDALLSGKTPLFPRVRLPIGRHRLLLESRNLDEHVLSEEFVIEVPDL